MLERLSNRNEFYIISNNPLCEALMTETGLRPNERKDFLNNVGNCKRSGQAIWRD